MNKYNTRGRRKIYLQKTKKSELITNEKSRIVRKKDKGKNERDGREKRINRLIERVKNENEKDE